MKKLVIYTCFTGDYDVLKDPVVRCPEADYVCFCETPQKSEIWQQKPLPKECATKALSSRYPKINPHELFPDYEYSLWIDANINVVDSAFFERIAALMDRGVAYAGVKHPCRDDIYDESRVVVGLMKETPSKAAGAVKFLLSEGFPRHFGLMENNIILRRHCDSEVVAFDSLWWSFLQKYTYRDQLSQSYCLWKTGLKPEFILPEGENARNSKLLEYVLHRQRLVTDRSLRGRWNVYRSDVRRFLYGLWLKTML